MKNKILFPVLTVLVIAGVLLVTGFLVGSSIIPSISTGTLNYGSSVCTSVTREDGTVEDLGCSHNVLYNTGKEAVEDVLTVGSGAGVFTSINLCNANITGGCTEPVAAKTETYNEITCCGLQEATGTMTTNGASSGNWSIVKTFTSTKDNVMTNATRLSNTTDDLAGNTFTLVTLQTNDQLTVNWTVWVE